MVSKKPILITGAHRSGSTWVGKIISESPSVRYVNEPFHVRNGLCTCGVRFAREFTYISDEDEDEAKFYRHIKHAIGISYNWTGAVKTIHNPKGVWRTCKRYFRFLRSRNSDIRPLVKDPIAVFSAEWLASRFDMDVVVLIRHPAAFASSLKRLNWTFPFSHLLDQPLLMKAYLFPFEAEIRKFAIKEHNIIDQAILLWRLIYYVVIKYQKKHPDWNFVRHEDISREPEHAFRTIFDRLNLEYSDYIKETIKKYSTSANPSEAPEGVVHFLRRDSKSNISNWKSRLANPEIEKIRIQVEDISSIFYSDEDW